MAKPAGRAWWIAAGVCHSLNVLVFSGAVWACIHWLMRSQTTEYYNTHRGADPDGMMFLELFMLGVCVVAACAAVYAMVGAVVTFAGHNAGPAMLWGSFPVTGVAGALAIQELCLGHAGLTSALVYVLFAVVAGGVCVGAMASGTPQRPKRQKGPMPPVPYAGGSPYLRPPGS